MPKNEKNVLCETPTPGKEGTRIPGWKYDAVRSAILEAVPTSKDGIESRTLPHLVEQVLSAELLAQLGSITWHTVTVKLHLEVLGEIERIPGSKSQRIRRVR